MKILSELSISFQQNKLYITDVVAKLETTLAMLEELKLQKRKTRDLIALTKMKNERAWV